MNKGPINAFCVRCKTRREMKNPEHITMSNGKPAVKDLCHVCGTKLFQIGDGRWS